MLDTQCLNKAHDLDFAFSKLFKNHMCLFPLADDESTNWCLCVVANLTSPFGDDGILNEDVLEKCYLRKIKANVSLLERLCDSIAARSPSLLIPLVICALWSYSPFSAFLTLLLLVSVLKLCQVRVLWLPFSSPPMPPLFWSFLPT